MVNKLTNLKGFGTGDPKPDGAKDKALKSRSGDTKKVLPYQVGGKPVYGVSNKHSRARHAEEDLFKKVRGEIDALAKKAR